MTTIELLKTRSLHKEPTEQIRLKGSALADTYLTETQKYTATLSAPLMTSQEEGLYRCHFVEVIYNGGAEVEFQQPPNTSFSIKHENILAPKGGEWEWIEGD